MTIKYLQNKNDSAGSVYKVDFATKKFVLVKCDLDMGLLPDISGKFGPNGFKHGQYDHFKQVPNPLNG